MNRSRLSLQLAGLCLATLIPTLALAIDPPARELTRFALSTNYLEDANEGLYELAYDNSGHHLFVAVTDRMNRAANKGFLYTFNPETLAVERRLEMPYRAFSLALAPTRHRLYVGHTQSASLRISLLDSETGKLLKTSDKLSFNFANAADARFEHLRHMVYSPASDTLFVSYSNMLKSGEGMQPVHKLLKLDGATQALKGEVERA